LSKLSNDKGAEIARITAAAEKLARRTNGQFVVDQAKLSGFGDRTERASSDAHRARVLKSA
jgi:hypothetical protein